MGYRIQDMLTELNIKELKEIQSFIKVVIKEKKEMEEDGTWYVLIC